MRKDMWMDWLYRAVRELIEQCSGMFEDFVDQVFDKNECDQKVVLNKEPHHGDGLDNRGKNHESQVVNWNIK